MPDKEEKKEPTKEEKLAKLTKELEKLKKEEVPKEEPKKEEPKKSDPESKRHSKKDESGKFVKKDPETPKEEEGKEIPTPLTEKEIQKLVDEKVREALKVKRKEPSKAKPVDEPVNRAIITKNWFEEIV